jgi:hypothetical protein
MLADWGEDVALELTYSEMIDEEEYERFYRKEFQSHVIHVSAFGTHQRFSPAQRC